MTDEELRLECLRLADGHLPEAERLYAFVKGRPALARPAVPVQELIFGKTPLAAWMRANGVNDRELGERVGLHTSAICRIRNGTHQPRLTAAVRLSEVTGISPADLRTPPIRGAA